MASNNVNVMVKEAVRALKANNKAEARSLLEKATELDPYNEQAWLWLSGVVETEDDQQTCLQNVLFINPGNENAKQGLAMLEAKSAARPKAEPKPANPEAFADFDLPSGDDWLAELDEMRTSATGMPSTNPFNIPIDEEFDSGDPFSDPFGDPFGAVDGPFSANTSLPPIAETSAPVVPASASLPTSPASPASSELDDLDALFAAPNAPASPVPDAPAKRGRPGRREIAAAPRSDPLDTITDDADAGTLFSIIPAEIRAGSLPGAVKKASTFIRLLFAALIVANIALLALIFNKVTTP
jgi:hypothetical protein